MAPHTETVLVTIHKVTPQRTRSDWQHPQGRKRWEIDAERVGDPLQAVWCSTLDVLKASLCDRARETGRQVLLTIRPVTLHGRFGTTKKVFNLVDVESVGDQVNV